MKKSTIYRLILMTMGALLVDALIEPYIIRSTYLSLPISSEQEAKLSRYKKLRPSSYHKVAKTKIQDAEKAKTQAVSKIHKLAKTPETEKTQALRLVFFSDLHSNNFHIPARKFCQQLLSSEPDLLVFGGDLISNARDKKKGLKIFRTIAEEAEKHSVPLFAIRGNHDKYLSNEELSSTGAIYAFNSSTIFRLKTKKTANNITCTDNNITTTANKITTNETLWRLSFLEDLRSGKPDYEQAIKQSLITDSTDFSTRFPNSRLQVVTEDCYLSSTQVSNNNKELIFAHNPDSLLNLNLNPSQYFFAGHFHGGQIRFPGRLEFKTLRKEQLCREGYYDGFFRYNGQNAFISCGAGSVLFPLRFLSLPEITVFDIN